MFSENLEDQRYEMQTEMNGSFLAEVSSATIFVLLGETPDMPKKLNSGILQRFQSSPSLIVGVPAHPGV